MTHPSFSRLPSIPAVHLVVLVLLAAPGEGSEEPLRKLREIRSAHPADDECDTSRDLVSENRFPPEGQPRSLVTIHRGEKCWTDRLVLWRLEGVGYRPQRVFDQGRAGAELFAFGGKRFLHLTQGWLSASHIWSGDLVLLVTEKGDLRVVDLPRQQACGAWLPAIGGDFEPTYGGHYSFSDGDLRFQWLIWNHSDESDPLNGTRVTGTLSVVESGETESGLRLVVEDCRVEPDE